MPNQQPELMQWSDGHGFIVLEIDIEDAKSGAHQGRCDDDIAALRTLPYIANQLDALDVQTVASIMREYGAWDREELADHDANLSRLLWIACGDLTEEAFQSANQ